MELRNEDLSKQQKHTPEISSLRESTGKAGNRAREREAGRSQDRKTKHIVCQLLAEKPNRPKETTLTQEEAYMNKGSEARAEESFKGHPCGKKPDSMFQGLLVRFTDTWTEEFFWNLKGAAAAPDELRSCGSSRTKERSAKRARRARTPRRHNAA